MIVQRAPGADLPVEFDRPNLVFQPKEPFSFTISPDVPGVEPDEPINIQVRLAASGGGDELWTKAVSVSMSENGRRAPQPIELEAPADEGAYTISVSVSRALGFSQKLLPLRRTVISSRDIEFVVVDPTTPSPALTEDWEEIFTVDPTNSRWWSRLPEWTRTHRLPGIRSGVLENVRPVIRDHPAGPMVELPPAAQGEPAWRAFHLPVKQPGEPHRLVINTPSERAQCLAVSIIERDAANRSMRLGRDLLLVQEDPRGNAGEETETIIFWPRTEAPVLLIANPHPDEPAQFGTIRLELQTPQPEAPIASPPVSVNQRLLAYYTASPAVFDALGGPEFVDAASSLSLDGWGSFLTAASRAAQSLKHGGYNTWIAVVASDGGSLYPSELLGPSPAFDSGLLASSGRDPIQKDVLELLFRVCDREGIRLIPMLDLTTPWAELELVASNDQAVDGPQSELVPQEPAAAERAEGHGSLVRELVQRYSGHPSLGGVGVRLSKPGSPGLAFANSAPSVKVVRDIAADILQQRSDLKLFIDTSSFIDFQQATPLIRDAVIGQSDSESTLLEQGILPDAWSSIPNAVVLQPQFIAPSDLSGYGAVRSRWSKFISDQWASSGQSGAWTLFGSTPLALPSFGSEGPFRDVPSSYRVRLQARPAGADGRRHITQAVARGDFDAIVEGGETGLFAVRAGSKHDLTLLAQLPPANAEVRVERAQPLTVRVFRHQSTTTACVVNDSPWPCNANLPLEAAEPIAWQSLHDPGAATGSDTGQQPHSGRTPRGASSWSLVLPPYSVRAWKFSSPRVRIGVPEVTPSQDELTDLKKQIADLEARTRNLDYRPLAKNIPNSGFELSGDRNQPNDWRPTVGLRGQAVVDRRRQRSGAASLYLRSYNDLGAAVVSSEIPAPATGQLVVSAYVQTPHSLGDNAELLVSAASDHVGHEFFAESTLATFQQPLTDWQRVEAEIEAVPLPRDAKLRLQILLKGSGEVWIDDVEISSLSINSARRVELVKRLYAAKAALAEGNVTDCRRLLDDYWSRRVVRHIPPWSGEQTRVAARDATTEPPPKDSEKPLGDRLRGFVPRILR
ncbi:MAG: hypothetical protein AAGA92_05775 [Planctomycetota bacterium]